MTRGGNSSIGATCATCLTFYPSLHKVDSARCPYCAAGSPRATAVTRRKITRRGYRVIFAVGLAGVAATPLGLLQWAANRGGTAGFVGYIFAVLSLLIMSGDHI